MFQLNRSKMKVKAGVSLAILVFFASGGLRADEGSSLAKITAINFRGTDDPSQIEIKSDRPITINRKVSHQDKQVVLEIPDATLDKSMSRNIDTSSFKGPVSLISPYEKNGSSPSVRIVIQLRSDVPVGLAQNGNDATLSIPGDDDVADRDPSQSQSGDDASQMADSSTDSTNATATESVAQASKDDNASSSPPASSRPRDQMDEFLQASKTKKFTGKPITLQVRDVDVQDIFSLIAQASGFNIILSDNVKGKLTLSLVDVPWDQALDVVLQTLHLGADRRGNVLRVDTLAALTQETQQELAAKRAQEAITPRITRIFPISYANLSDLKKILTNLANAEQATATGATAGPSSGPNGSNPTASSTSDADSPLTVVTDERTNSLIVRGLPEYVDRARKIIQILDTQTPQVMIEAKVVEATESFARNLGGNIAGVETEAGHGYGVSFNGGNPYDSLFGAGGTKGGIFDVVSAIGGMTAGYTRLIGGNRINSTLSMAESENKVKLISSPRTVVMNKQNASLVQSFPAAISTQTISNGTVLSTPTQIDANLSLNVTPTVTSDGSVLMKLNLSRDVIQQPDPSIAPVVAKRNIQTNVLVDSGNTLVLGGFYNTESDETEAGIPFFRKIPIIGWLFGTKKHNRQRSELLFFITPQVLNPKKSGMVGST